MGLWELLFLKQILSLKSHTSSFMAYGETNIFLHNVIMKIKDWILIYFFMISIKGEI